MFAFAKSQCRRLSKGVLLSATLCTLLFFQAVFAPEEARGAPKGKGKAVRYAPLTLESPPDPDADAVEQFQPLAVEGERTPPPATEGREQPSATPTNDASVVEPASERSAGTPDIEESDRTDPAKGKPGEAAASAEVTTPKPTSAAAPVVTKTAQAQSSSGPPAGSAKPIRLFGTVEFRSPIKNLPKWERVRGAERKAPSFTAKGAVTKNTAVAKRWASVKNRVQDASLLEKVREVNKFFNTWPYKTDREVWGVEDYWATPREFMQKSGDCEDYAISKYYALRDLDVPANRMRIAAVKDTIRNIGHAVLIVYMNDDAYVLDNLTNLVLSHKKLTHYAPQYTVNEEYLWRHVKPKSSPK